MERGQTSFDFAVGMGIFLLSVGFVLTFIPTIFQPFAVGSGGDEIVGDRIASNLVEDALVENVSRPAVLNASCTSKLFDETVTSPVIGCGYKNATLAGAIGASTTNVNVTIRKDDSPADPSWSSDRLTLGDAPRPDADVTISRRVVRIEGEVYELWVRVW